MFWMLATGIERPAPASKHAHNQEQEEHQRRELERLVSRQKPVLPVNEKDGAREDGDLREGRESAVEADEKERATN